MLALLFLLAFWAALSVIITGLLVRFASADDLFEASITARWFLCWAMAPAFLAVLVFYQEWVDLKYYVVFLFTMREPKGW